MEMESVVITGGLGFIGSCMVESVCALYPKSQVHVLDCETYAARPPTYNKPKNLTVHDIDIRDQLAVRKFMQKYRPENVIHMAAESHVCRSIEGPRDFMTTNFLGTWNMLEESKELKEHGVRVRFLHFSTDEVFGVALKGKFDENSRIDPRSPYAASKAASDLIVMAYHHTYGLDTSVVNCSNNFGPNQHEEKLVPKVIKAILANKPVEIYGTGSQVRDWIYVQDCVFAALRVLAVGESGERYCIGGEMELTNLEMVEHIYSIMADLFPNQVKDLKMVHTDSRPTDDQRYAINNRKIKEIGWHPKPEMFLKNLRSTILWYYSYNKKASRPPQGWVG